MEKNNENILDYVWMVIFSPSSDLLADMSAALRIAKLSSLC